MLRFALRQRAAIRSAFDRLGCEFFCRFPRQPKAAPFFKQLVWRTLLKNLAAAAYWLDTYRNVIKRTGARMVVSSTYSSMQGRAAAWAARQQNVISVYVQHGILTPEYVYSHFCQDIKLLWGDSDRRYLSSHGHRPESLVVTGATLYDAYVRSLAEEKERCPAVQDPIIAFMAPRTGGAVCSVEASREVLCDVIDCVEALGSATLLVKKHPGDASAVLQEIVSRYPRHRMVEDGNSQDVIQQADIIVVVSSTTGYEACLAGKPLIVFVPNGLYDYTQFAAYDAAIRVSTRAELLKALQHLTTDGSARSGLAEGQKTFVQDALNGGGGGAAQLAAAALWDVLQKSN